MPASSALPEEDWDRFDDLGSDDGDDDDEGGRSSTDASASDGGGGARTSSGDLGDLGGFDVDEDEDAPESQLRSLASQNPMLHSSAMLAAMVVPAAYAVVTIAQEFAPACDICRAALMYPLFKCFWFVFQARRANRDRVKRKMIRLMANPSTFRLTTTSKQDLMLDMALRMKRTAAVRQNWEDAVQFAAARAKGVRRSMYMAAPDLLKAEATLYPKTDRERDFIFDALKRTMVFMSLKRSDIDNLVEHMKDVSSTAGSVIIQKGDRAEAFFVIHKGELEVTRRNDDGEVTTEILKAGETYGEMSLLYNKPQDELVAARTDTSGWVLTKNTYRGILARSSNESSTSIRDLLASMSIMQTLREEQLNKLADVAVEIQYKHGQTIVKKGEEGKICYGIMSGTVRITDIDGDVPDVTLGDGQYFGELALITRTPRSATAIADSEVVKLVAISTDDTRPILGELSGLFLKKHQTRAMQSVPLFKQISPEVLSSLVDAAVTKTFKEGEYIIRRGEVGDAFYLIQEGLCDVVCESSDGERCVVKTLGRNKYFGEMSLIKNVRRNADIVARAKTTVLEVNKEWFDRVVRSSSLFSRDIGRVVKDRFTDLRRSANPAEKVKKEDLETVAFIGKGAFGRVTVVTEKESGLCYALKAMNIKTIEENSMSDMIVCERRAMMLCDHPFILKLHRTFKDEYSVYFLLDYIVGGELYDVIKRNPQGVEEKDAKFYGACILLALEHLSIVSLAYRDMKPENTLIDDEGYCIMIDMGFSKPAQGKRFTFCGTPDYMAPEIILHKGHNRAVDYWAFGVLLYEMSNGVTPFQDYSQDATLKNVLRGKVRYPDSMSKPLVALIQALLTVDPTKRLGMLVNGTEDIIKHEWFSDIDFCDLAKKEVKAPWIPETEDEADTSNFDKDLPTEESQIDKDYVSYNDWLAEF